MAKRNLTIIIGNPLMKLLLRSPWHRVASQEIMLITVTGRKSGKRYTTPVNYVEDEESGILTVLTHQHRTWWRNLGDGAPVTVLVRGKTLTGTGYAYTAGSDLAERFFYYLSAHPNHASTLT